MATKVRRNGNATEALDIAAGPRLPRDEEWWEVEGIDGFRVRLWANFPTALWRQAIGVSSTADQQREALRQIVLEHNGWLDPEGLPYPSADAENFYEIIPNRVLLHIVRTVQVAQGTLPNFQMPTRRT